MVTIDLLGQRTRMASRGRCWGVVAPRLLLTVVLCLASLAASEPHVRGGDSLNNDERRGATGSSGSRQAQRALQDDEILIQGSLLACSDFLQAADADANSFVDRFEWANYVALQSIGRVNSPFMFLPVQFIAIFYSESCTTCYEETEVSDCCVGDSAAIDVSKSDPERYYNTLVYVCLTTQQQLDEMELPSINPTAIPETVAPAPTEPGTTAPATSPPETTAPATTPPEPGSDAPSDAPSVTATVAATTAPTMAPVVAATAAPSDSPSQGPTTAPSDTPSQALTIAPTPTPILSSSPTIAVPVSPDTAAPSAMPSQADLVCVEFSFLLNNDIGLSAEDLLNEVNNTLKTGLEIAGRNITIEIMNTSFPGGAMPEDPESLLPGGNGTRRALDRPAVVLSPSRLPGAHVVADAGALLALQAGLADKFGQDGTTDILRSFGHILRPSSPPSLHRHQRYPGGEDLRRLFRMLQERRLVYYTDEFPSTVFNIRQNFLCDGAQEGVLCSVVEQFSCVVLEEGDDRALVQTVLASGIREAINNGDFERAIPPENIP
jgi:hypothetical protein